MDNYFEAFSISIVIVVILIYFVTTFLRSYYLLIKKGFTNHGASLLVILFFIASITLPVFPPIFGLHIYGKKYAIYAFSILVIVPITLLGYAKYIVKLPMRRYGERNFKVLWKIISNLAMVASLVSLLLFLCIMTYTWINTSFKIAWEKSRVFSYLFPQLLSIHYLFQNYERLFFKKSIEDVINKDQRSPVLFVRSFSMDVDPFFWGNIHKSSNHVSTDLAIFNQYNQSSNLTFQQFFVKAIEENIGPLIGFGDPSRYLPLEGLTSSYYDDKNWQTVFNDWAQKAIYIITIPGKTEGLKYELNYIFASNLADRFFIFTSPKTRGNSKIMKWLMSVETCKWSEFAENMNDIGYKLQVNEPPSGSVIGFDKLGNQKILITGARYPIHYIQAIKK